MLPIYIGVLQKKVVTEKDSGNWMYGLNSESLQPSDGKTPMDSSVVGGDGLDLLGHGTRHTTYGSRGSGIGIKA